MIKEFRTHLFLYNILLGEAHNNILTSLCTFGHIFVVVIEYIHIGCQYRLLVFQRLQLY